jgi:ankyrin repeat protein
VTSENGHIEVVKLLLLDGKADSTADNSYCLREASENGHTEVVKLLLSDGRADPTANNSYCLRWASKNGHTEVVALLLADGRADPTANNSNCLRWAAQNGHTEIVNLITSHLEKLEAMKKKEEAMKKKEEAMKKKEKVSVSMAIELCRKAMSQNKPKVVSFLWSRKREELREIVSELVDWCVKGEHLELLESLIE